VQIDTSTVATGTIDYVATNQSGLTSAIARTVIVEAAGAPATSDPQNASLALASSYLPSPAPAQFELSLPEAVLPRLFSASALHPRRIS
jgi:hypothetical protein